MRYLRTNTAVRISVGPFLSCTDGVTPQTALTVTNSTAELFYDKDEGSAVTRTALTLTASGGTNDMVHVTDDTAGMYDLELTAAQVNFLGRAKLIIFDTDVHLTVIEEFEVISQSWYDAMFGTGAISSAVAIGGIASTAFAAGAIDSAATNDNFIAEIWAKVVEGTLTAEQILKICLAALAGKAAGGGTATITFRDVADSKNRISATVTNVGNRSAVVLDGT